MVNHSFCFIFRLLHFSQSTTVWDDLIDNLWRHILAVGVVLVAVAVGFSRFVGVCCSLESRVDLCTIRWEMYGVV